MASPTARAEKWRTFVATRFLPHFLDDIKPRLRATVLGILTAVLVLLAQIHYGVITGGVRPRLLSILWPYGLLLLVFVIYHLARTPWLISNEHLDAIAVLNKTILERESITEELNAAIRSRDDDLRAIKEPKRSAAEQHAYDTLKQALEVTKETGLTALRHLRYHEKLAFGTYNPELPPGLTREQTLWVYNHCLSVGIVNRNANPGHSELSYSFSSNPAMVKALDDLLFPEDFKG